MSYRENKNVCIPQQYIIITNSVYTMDMDIPLNDLPYLVGSTSVFPRNLQALLEMAPLLDKRFHDNDVLWKSTKTSKQLFIVYKRIGRRQCPAQGSSPKHAKE